MHCTLTTTALLSFSNLLKVTLGVVVEMLSLMTEMPVGLPVVARTRGGQLEPLVTEIMGKHHLQTPTSNLLIINKQVKITHKIKLRYFKLTDT